MIDKICIQLTPKTYFSIEEDRLGILRTSRVSFKAYAISEIKKQPFFGKEKAK